ncbi:MAG TPA: glucose-6-phosphate dehydrogenase [Propionibacterium sp.]|jgi:glucose-6-phosphate 1-dehydrogenase|nr:glucose-6-phosphate dehydrogenase [Propionibacterium sp.]
MTAKPINFVILGASGDLAARLLLPGLGTLLATNGERQMRVIGVARSEKSDAEWQDLIRSVLGEQECGHEALEQVATDSRWRQVEDYSGEEIVTILKDLDGPSVLYFALPPEATGEVCADLCGLELPDDLVLALEKPFGHDLEGAQRLNALLAQLVPEERVFRVDHFLGKNTVLNVLGVRFANLLLESAWTADRIERIEIIADETLALEGRAGYYDTAGALIDMVQSHLLLVMCLVTMEEPARIATPELPDLMMHTLRSTQLWGDDPVASSRRARYTAGEVEGKQVPAYIEEDGVDPDRQTETLAEVTLEIRNQRWAGVPITLRSGKALAENRSTIEVHFRPMRHLPEGLEGGCPVNVLTIGMTPQHIGLSLATNTDTDRLRLTTTHLGAELGESPLRPYGEILGRIFDRDHLLSVRGDVAEECWRVLEPVIEAWRADRVPLEEYAAGSAGEQSPPR